jgi:O-antigen/teichoic acid export membrane protein
MREAPAMRRWLHPRSGLWVGAESLMGAAISFCGLLLIARMIGPEAAGVGAVATSLFLLVDLPVGALFGDALLQRRALEERHRSSAFWATLAVALLAALALAAVAPLLARAVGRPEVSHMLRALACLLPLSGAAGLLSALALREQRYRLLALRALLCQPLAIAAGTMVAQGGGGAWALVAQQATATVGVLLLLAARSSWWPRGALPRRADLADLWPVAGPQILALLLFSARYRLFVAVLGVLADEVMVAVTHIAFRFVEVVATMIAGGVNRLAMPRLAGLQQDRDALAEAYGDLTQLQALLTLPAACGLGLVAPVVIGLMLGDAWSAAAEPARLLALGVCLSALAGPAGALWLAVARTGVSLLMQAIATAVPLGALLLLAPSDAQGAAICWVLGTAVVLPLQAALVLRQIRRGPVWLIGCLAPALTGTLVLIAATAPILAWTARLPGWTALALSVGAGIIGFLAGMLLPLGGKRPRAWKAV